MTRPWFTWLNHWLLTVLAQSTFPILSTVRIQEEDFGWRFHEALVLQAVWDESPHTAGGWACTKPQSSDLTSVAASCCVLTCWRALFCYRCFAVHIKRGAAAERPGIQELVIPRHRWAGVTFTFIKTFNKTIKCSEVIQSNNTRFRTCVYYKLKTITKQLPAELSQIWMESQHPYPIMLLRSSDFYIPT